MDIAATKPSKFVAVVLAGVVAVIHLILALLNWLKWVTTGLFLPREFHWPVFLISSLLIVSGLLVATLPRYRRPIYAGGILLMGGHVVGYFGWHFGGHQPWLVVEQGASYHEGPLVPFLLDHLFAGPMVFLTIGSEVTLAVVLGYLLATNPQ